MTKELYCVHKYTLELRDGPQNPSIPIGAEILHVGMQHGKVQMWAWVDVRQEATNRLFAVYATGQPISTVGSHIGTVQDGPYVWHVFEVL